MSKIFVLRSGSLLSSVDSTLRFGSDNEIVIPMVVIDQLQCYNGKPEKCKIASQILSYIESLDIKKLKREGIKQVNGSVLKVFSEKTNKSIDLEGITDIDRKIFEVCFNIMERNPEKQVILVSKNASIRIKARSIGILAEDFRDDLFPTPDEQYTGRQKIQVSKESINDFYEKGYISIDKVYEASKISWIENMFLEINSYDSPQSTLGRYDGQKIVPLVFSANNYPMGITAKNAGQQMLLECLLTSWEAAPLVIVKGGAGTGKTYCSLAYALDQLEDFRSRILVATPSETVGNERLGFLPGDIRDKFSPYLGGIKDNLSILINGKRYKKEKDYPEENGEYYFERGLIQVQPIGFLRGRTIVNSIFIIDETQNIDPGEIKSIVTRAAEGSKFIFLGDPTQVDNPRLNERYNGLVYLSEKMKGNPLCWQISLENAESVRSELSRVASKLL